MEAGGLFQAKNKCEGESRMTSAPKKVAIYARVACEDQADIVLTAQECQLREYAKEHNYEVVKAIREIGSGLTCEHPGLCFLLQASSQEFQGVLVKRLDRIGRAHLKVMEWIERLETSGKKLISMEENTDSTEELFLYREFKKIMGQ